MKFDCELIQDLIPLYEEGLCSNATRQAVEIHFQECEHCRRLSAPLPIETPEDPPAADRAVKKSMKEVRRRWLASLLAAVMAVPMLLMSVNQFRGNGLCFTNLDDMLIARRFLTALERGDWERAASLYDYSADYANIMDALDQEVADWGVRYTPVQLDGMDYMLKSYLDPALMDGDAANAVFHFLFNQMGSAMIPAALWEQVIAVDPTAFHQEDGRYWLDTELYGMVTTPWGDFITNDGRRCDTPAEYCTYFDLVPAALYEEARAELEAEAWRLYSETHASYGYVASMTEAEFLSHMAQSYANDLKAFEKKLTFDHTGFRGAYRLWENDGWHIRFGVTLTYLGKPLDTTVAIGVRDRKVCIVSLSCEKQTDWLYEIENALYPSAHPDY